MTNQILIGFQSGEGRHISYHGNSASEAVRVVDGRKVTEPVHVAAVISTPEECEEFIQLMSIIKRNFPNQAPVKSITSY